LNSSQTPNAQLFDIFRRIQANDDASAGALGGLTFRVQGAAQELGDGGPRQFATESGVLGHLIRGQLELTIGAQRLLRKGQILLHDADLDRFPARAITTPIADASSMPG
jgi:hypothetical protein